MHKYTLFYAQESKTFSKCSRYTANWTDILNNNTEYKNELHSNWKTESCVDGWEYNTSHVMSSIVIDVGKTKMKIKFI